MLRSFVSYCKTKETWLHVDKKLQQISGSGSKVFSALDSVYCGKRIVGQLSEAVGFSVGAAEV